MKIQLSLKKRTPPQKRIANSLARFNVAAWGRQSGKTTFGVDKMIYKPLMGRALGIYWYILQTSNAAEIAFNRYWHELKKAPHLMLDKPNQTEKKVTLLNGATVFFKSGHNFEDLRAETLDGAIIDEVRQQDPKLWPMVIRPMLSKRKGWADFYSTPNGFDHFYDLAIGAQSKPDWAYFQAPSSEAWWWDEEEIASAKAELSEAQYAQEIDAEFRNIHVGKAYSSDGPHNRLLASPFCTGGALVSPYLPVTLGLDFNVNPMCWTLGQFRGQISYWFDEIHIENTNTIESAKELAIRLVALRDQGLLKGTPNVRICGDATGNSRNTKATESDYTIICGVLDHHKITWSNDTPESNPPVKDRVNTMNARLKAADGSTTLFYHPLHCKKLARDMDRVTWKAGTSGELDQKTDKTLTHQSDSVGYPVCVYSPVELSGAVGKMHIIRR